MKTVKVAPVRYGKLGSVELFRCELPELQEGDLCIVRSDRGTETGILLALPEPLSPDLDAFGLGKLLRKATARDLAVMRTREVSEQLEFTRACERLLEGLPVRLLCCEYLFGGEKVIFHFSFEPGREADLHPVICSLSREFGLPVEFQETAEAEETPFCRGVCSAETCPHRADEPIPFDWDDEAAGDTTSEQQ